MFARLIIVAVFMTAATAAHAQDTTLWRCGKPSQPFRYVSSEAKKSTPPPCEEWVQIRGMNLDKVLAALSDETFKAANVFLGEAADASTMAYPDSAKGKPVSTNMLYRDPSAYGFKTTSIDEAPTGSFVLYDGLGGILVETRGSENEPWTKQVLYPSAAAGGRLTLSDPTIPGKAAPRVLIKDKM